MTLTHKLGPVKALHYYAENFGTEFTNTPTNMEARTLSSKWSLLVSVDLLADQLGIQCRTGYFAPTNNTGCRYREMAIKLIIRTMYKWMWQCTFRVILVLPFPLTSECTPCRNLGVNGPLPYIIVFHRTMPHSSLSHS